MNTTNESVSMQSESRVAPWDDKELLVDAWRSCQRRLGPTFSVASTKLDVRNLVKASKTITGSIEDNYFWILEVLAEVKLWLANGRLTMEEIGG